MLSQVGMDKALNQLSVPLGQLQEEVMVCVLFRDTVIKHICVNFYLKSIYARVYL